MYYIIWSTFIYHIWQHARRTSESVSVFTNSTTVTMSHALERDDALASRLSKNVHWNHWKMGVSRVTGVPQNWCCFEGKSYFKWMMTRGTFGNPHMLLSFLSLLPLPGCITSPTWGWPGASEQTFKAFGNPTSQTKRSVWHGKIVELNGTVPASQVWWTEVCNNPFYPISDESFQ